MTLVTRARSAGILAISLLMLGAPGAMAGVGYSKPDASIRLGSGSYVGEAELNLDATGQSVFGSGPVGQKLTFFIKIANDGVIADGFKVARSAGYNNGYRVRYYDAANHDVTGQVTAGSFTTPSLLPDQTYQMRATVKVRTLATLCSFTSRRLTVSANGNSNARDAVRFTAARATPDLNCAPVAFNDTASITENSTTVSGYYVANDTDPDGDPMTIWSLGGIPGVEVYGSLSWNSSAGFYLFSLDNADPAVDALNDGETLTQVFLYSVYDGGLESNVATITITIHGVTDPD